MKVGTRTIGDGEPAFVLAEVASAHQGEAVQALDLASNARNAGAEGVKFQLFRSQRLVPPNASNRAVFDRIELSTDDWGRVLTAARSLGIPVFADVFDRESLAIGEEHGVAAYKIHSTDMENSEFIRAVAATGKPVLLSTGGSSLATVDHALSECRSEGAGDVMLLHGVQNFPTEAADSNLRFIETLKRTFGVPVGFLDHVDGGSPMALALPALAVAFGANLVEKHTTLDRSAQGFDYESSLEKTQFASMVELIRQAEASFGEAHWQQSDGAERYHRMMRRAVLSRVDLKQGVPLMRDHLAFLRHEEGVSPDEAGALIGRKPSSDIAAWTPLTEDLFD